MKQTYRHSDAERTTLKKIAIGAGIFIVGFFVLSYDPLQGAISQGVYRVAPRVWEIGKEASDAKNSFIGAFAFKRTLVKENELLRDEISRMRAEVLDRGLLKERVAKLEAMLGRENSGERVVANVLAGPGRSPYDTYIIDVGEDHHIALGDRVVYAGASVIGEISEVHTSSSKVKLFSSPDGEIAVRIGTTTIPSVAKGRGMGNFEARVPQGSVVAPGENVITSENLILGVIGAVIADEAMPFVRVLFSTPFNVTGVEMVEVIRSTSQR